MIFTRSLPVPVRSGPFLATVDTKPSNAGQLILAPFRVMKSNLLRVSGGALAKHWLLDHEASGQPDWPDRGDLGVAHLLEELNVIPGNSYRHLQLLCQQQLNERSIGPK